MEYNNEFENNNLNKENNNLPKINGSDSEAVSDRKEEIPFIPEEEKVQNVSQEEPVQETSVHNGYNGESQENKSYGIRYDRNENDGNNYTWNYSNTPVQKPKKKNKNGFTVFVAAAMAFIILGTAAVSSVITSNIIEKGSVFGDFTNEPTQDKEAPIIGKHEDENDTQPMVSVPALNGSGVLTKQQIAVKCKPSSVGIEVVSTVRSIYGYSYQTSGVGSGFILTEDGYVATNNHVIEGATTITVMLDDGTRHEAKLIGADAITDLAVIKIEKTGLVPMQIGDSDKMVVGDSVVAIGTPAGIEFAGTVTDGIISAINRGVEITNDRGTVVKTMTLMQTNAAINPGNSGGPLINDRGEVIGINTLKLTSTYEGIGFSIPINSAVKIFNQLISDGKVSEYDSSFVTGNGAIGITQYAEISKQEAEYYGIPQGIIVIQIKNTSAAVSEGLRRGDIITGFCGTDVKTVEELNKLKSKYKAGDEVTLHVYRDGEGKIDITFRLDLMES